MGMHDEAEPISFGLSVTVRVILEGQLLWDLSHFDRGNSSPSPMTRQQENFIKTERLYKVNPTPPLLFPNPIFFTTDKDPRTIVSEVFESIIFLIERFRPMK